MKFSGILCLMLGNIFLWSFIQTLAVNNLNNNDNWIVAKALSIYPLQGSYESLLSRSVLMNSEAHLDSYYGYQEIRSSHSEPIDRFDFQVFFGEGSYLDVFFASHEDLRDGVRFSADKGTVPILFSANSDYKFTKRQIWEKARLTPGWHEISLRQSPGGVSVFLNQKRWFEIPGAQVIAPIGFRGNLHPISLSKVEAYRQGRLQWREGFWGEAIFRRVLPWNALVTVALAFVLLLADRVGRSEWSGKTLFRTLRLIFLFGLIWYSFDFFYYSRLPLENSVRGRESIHPTIVYMNTVKLQSRFFQKWLSLYRVPIHEGYRKDRDYHVGTLDFTFCENDQCVLKGRAAFDFVPKEKNEVRLLMLGGSMYQGAGIFSMDKTLFARIFFALEKDLGKNRKVRALNGSMAGDSIADQVDHFLSSYRKFEPDLIITGFLDSTEAMPTEFEALEKFVQYTSIHHIPVIFLRPPYNLEAYLGYTNPLERTREMLAKYGVEVVNLNNVTYDPRIFDQGIIWWDKYHLTNYGQGLLSDYTTPFALQIFRNP
jgi:hypothetical protein